MTTRPDLTLLGPASTVPVVGVILAHKQLEYGKNSLHEMADKAITDFLSKQKAAIVAIDTALDNNKGGLRSAGEIESLIAKMDVVITTRLHGTVLSIKNGVPVIPIDPVAGGAKISLQVKTLNWPVLFMAESVDEQKLSDAFTYCLSLEAKDNAKHCAENAARKLEKVKQDLFTELKRLSKTELTHGS
jgi:polysaccharide pyruvyl transferase WcaK-like protein